MGLEEPTVSSRCEAALDRAVGRYSKCLIKASARVARHRERDIKEASEAKVECREEFEEAVGGALDRYKEENCTSFIMQMEERTTSYAADIALEARGTPAPKLLFVQSSGGAGLTDSTVTLTGVSEQTGWLTDRPYREVGQVRTENFLAAWDVGADLFATVLPDADFTCEVDGKGSTTPRN